MKHYEAPWSTSLIVVSIFYNKRWEATGLT